MAPTKRSPAGGFLIALAAVTAATVVWYLLRGILGNSFVFTLFVLPVMLAGWYGGLRPGLFATVVSAFLSVMYILPPVGELYLISPADVLRVGLFLFCGTVVSLLCESLHRTERLLLRAERAGNATLANISDAYFGLDREGRLAFLNPSARQLLASQGHDPAAMVGLRLIEDCFPDIQGSPQEALIRAAAANRITTTFEIHYGPWNRWFSVRVFPADDGGLSIHSTEITDLRRTEERLRTALEGANLTAFEWDIRTGQVVRLAEPGSGTPLGGEFNMADGMSTVHPEDQEALREHVQAAVSGDSPFFLAEYRTNDNTEREWCWRRTRARVIRAADGSPVTMIGVSMDISDHKRLEEALREADRRKDNYVAMLAHELRNPLAPIRNAVHLLKAEGSASPQAAFSHEVIDRQSRHMARLLDDLLNVSRVARGTLELRREQVALRTVIASAVETTQPAIESRNHQVELRLPAQDVLLHADPSRLAQVFANLLANAARYTEDGGLITVDARVDGDHVLTTVRDNGVGIPPDQIDSIFELFTQAAPAHHGSREGMGIGLALSRSLVELHAGTLEARSEGPGHGSQFIVRLPLSPDASSQALEATGTGQSRPAVWRILVADDSRDNADSLAELLRFMGHDVATAYDGEEALVIAAAFQPRAVLLDLGMPRLDGFETCRRLRAMPPDEGLIIIALTGWGQASDREQTSAAGFDAHLVKPIDPAAAITLLNLLGQTNSLPA